MSQEDHPVQEKPSAVARPSNAFLGDPEVERFALLLNHRCFAWERTSGTYRADRSGAPVFGDEMKATFTCAVCGSVRKVQSWNDFADWIAIQHRSAVQGNRAAVNEGGNQCPTESIG